MDNKLRTFSVGSPDSVPYKYFSSYDKRGAIDPITGADNGKDGYITVGPGYEGNTAVELTYEDVGRIFVDLFKDCENLEISKEEREKNWGYLLVLATHFVSQTGETPTFSASSRVKEEEARSKFLAYREFFDSIKDGFSRAKTGVGLNSSAFTSQVGVALETLREQFGTDLDFECILSDAMELAAAYQTLATDSKTLAITLKKETWLVVGEFVKTWKHSDGHMKIVEAAEVVTVGGIGFWQAMELVSIIESQPGAIDEAEVKYLAEQVVKMLRELPARSVEALAKVVRFLKNLGVASTAPTVSAESTSAVSAATAARPRSVIERRLTARPAGRPTVIPNSELALTDEARPRGTVLPTAEETATEGTAFRDGEAARAAAGKKFYYNDRRLAIIATMVLFQWIRDLHNRPAGGALDTTEEIMRLAKVGVTVWLYNSVSSLAAKAAAAVDAAMTSSVRRTVSAEELVQLRKMAATGETSSIEVLKLYDKGMSAKYVEWRNLVRGGAANFAYFALFESLNYGLPPERAADIIAGLVSTTEEAKSVIEQTIEKVSSGADGFQSASDAFLRIAEEMNVKKAGKAFLDSVKANLPSDSLKQLPK